jgi:RNA polymerase primary sigma factor
MSPPLDKPAEGSVAPEQPADGGAGREQRDADRELTARLPAVPTESSGAYLRELDRRPRLSEEGERELVAAAQSGDLRARERLIEAFIPLIAAVARMYRQAPGVERNELIQEGVVGLLRALERYDPDRGVPFWGYAAWWVRQAMQQLVAELARPVVLSDRALRQLARVKDVHRAQLRERGREPSLQELAEGTSLSVEQLSDLVAADLPARGLQESRPGEEGSLGTFGDLLVDPLVEDAYERVLEDLQIEQMLRLLSGLSEREHMVLRARYGLDGKERTLKEIAERLGVSSERVRQIEQRALAKLRARVGAH